MNDLENHKKKDSFKWAVTGISLFLIMIILLGLCLQIFGNDSLKPMNWFNDKQEETELKEPELDEELKNHTVVSIDESTDIKFSKCDIKPDEFENLGVAAASESAFTLTALVEPENCLNKTVSWEINWANPSSDWANGKNVSDYVLLEPNGINTAVVSCLKGFNEQILINAISEDNPNVKSSKPCRVDYVKRTTLRLFFESENFNNEGYKKVILDCNSKITIRYEVQHDLVGTIEGVVKCGTLLCSLSSDFRNKLFDKTKDIGGFYVLDETTDFIKADFSSKSSISTVVGDVFAFAKFYDNYPVDRHNDFLEGFYSTANEITNTHLVFHFPYTLEAPNGKVIQRYETQCTAIINLSSIGVRASDINLSENGIVF